ncbi:MAG: cysteine--tRNA ligase [Oscillospiraceae bacterium]|jgi:cysteinyl-tRNA synthetase|nr:cysteine--tRNA ligase [Oscillospiraceae bacterium]
MKIYNTLTKNKDDFIPSAGVVTVYVCGPTVYNYIHIGNARPLCVFDVLVKYLKHQKYEVKHIQNFTDVDDKIINKAAEEGVAPSEIALKYIKEYKKDAHGLNIRDADVTPKVTENIDCIVEFISMLSKKGYTYQTDSGVYFRTAKFKKYGALSCMPIEDLQAGARIDTDSDKENVLDFALWKAAKPGEPAWNSPWGMGRPGWHIECSAMARRYGGKTLDIHCGGQDLIFPHHENEIAQTEAATDEPLARYWMHNGYINVDSQKMSKSKGNFFTVREVAGVYGYDTVRYLMLQTHYRSPINYSEELLESCKVSLERIYNCRGNLQLALDSAQWSGSGRDFSSFKDRFFAALSDDLNTADAISVLFELVREINKILRETVSRETLTSAFLAFDEFCDLLGIEPLRQSVIPEEVQKLADLRKKAKKARNFELADEYRSKIADLGYTIEDTRQGVKIVRT